MIRALKEKGKTPPHSETPDAEVATTKVVEPPKPEPADPELEQPIERVFTTPVATVAPDVTRALKVDRGTLPHPKGYHVAFDYPTRLDLKLVVTNIKYKIETLTDPATGRSYRAPTIGEGPRDFNVTWDYIASAVKLIVGYAIPINRVDLMIGRKGFSSGKLCRLLAYLVKHLFPIYLELSERLADVKVVSGDDTKAKVLDVSIPSSPEGDEPTAIAKMLTTLDERLGFQAARKDGKGDIKSLNVTLLMGRENPKDKRSTICFFWTHFGYVGNLLTKILEMRSPRIGPLVFQGDLSSANLPDKELRKLITVILSGCGAHSRRPFWRYRDDDPDLCYYMLRGFALLAAVETMIDRAGRTRERTLRLRAKYSRKIWQALKNRCIAAATGERLTAATKPYTKPPLIRWPKTTKLRKAVEYVIGNFEELTRYIEDPRLEFTNNARERGLRGEVCMRVASKFRKTRHGRANLDILRTINATCTAAELDLAVYLRYVWQHLDDVHDHPEKFTPYAVVSALAARSVAREKAPSLSLAS